MKINCEIIRDLLPLYAEGLCSGESRNLIESHLKTCADCRKLADGLPDDTPPEAIVPEESKALKKVSRKLKRGKLWVAVLIVLLLELGYLTAGQLLKRTSIQSFETVWRSIEVYPLARMLARGDFDRYAAYMTTGELYNHYTYKYYDEIHARDIADLKASFQAAYGGSEVGRISVQSCYDYPREGGPSVIYTDICIRYKDGNILELEGGKDEEGLFGFSVITSSNENDVQEAAAQEFQDVMRYVNHHGNNSLFISEVLFTTEKLPADPETRFTLLSHRFQPAYQTSAIDSIKSFLGKGYCTTYCTISAPRYDAERHMLYYEMTLTGRDTRGTAILAGRMYFDHTGYIPPQPEDVTVYRNGCTDGLAEALLHFFG